MPKRKKPISPFGLDMAFDEALERYAQTKPKEVEKNIRLSKKKKPPGGKKRKPSGGIVRKKGRR